MGRNSKVIAMIGRPRNAVGILVPILNDTTDSKEIEEAIKEEAVTLVENPIEISEVIPNYNPKKVYPTNGFSLGAYIFYSSRESRELLENDPVFFRGIKLRTRYEQTRFNLVNTQDLRGNILPTLFEKSSRKLEQKIKEGSERKDYHSLEKFGDIVCDTSYNEESAQKAIDYSGLILLKMKPENYEAWLRVFLKVSPFAQSFSNDLDYHKQRSLELFDRLTK